MSRLFRQHGLPWFALSQTPPVMSPSMHSCSGGRRETVKKLQVRKTGPVRLTSVMTPFYGTCGSA
jgi:hypothetical protein